MERCRRPVRPARAPCGPAGSHILPGRAGVADACQSVTVPSAATRPSLPRLRTPPYRRLSPPSRPKPMKTGTNQSPRQSGIEPATVGKRRLKAITDADAAWWAVVQAHGPEHPALVSTATIAKAMGRSPATVRWWRWRGAFPPPVIVRGRLRHLRRDVQVWAFQHGRVGESVKAEIRTPTTCSGPAVIHAPCRRARYVFRAPDERTADTRQGP